MSETFLSSYYGQPPGAYYVVERRIFAFSEIPLEYQGGYKIHVSVSPETADRAARTLLPTLRLLHVHHKVVKSVADYQRMCQGHQAGKFITIYPGPAGRAQRVLDTLDPVLIGLRSRPTAHSVHPGPLPRTRQSNHLTTEIRVGNSGMVSTYWTDDYSE